MLCLCSILLAGCTATGETLSTETTVFVQATLDNQMGETLPWSAEVQEEMSYETYFGTVRPYSLDGDDGELCMGLSWGDYSISSGDGVLLVTDVFGTVKHTVPDVDGDVQWVTCDSSWVYGVRNGTELLRIDYWGENEEVLYNDGIHSIGVEYSGYVYLGDNCTLFFAACSDQGSVICRLYLPEMTLDILAENDRESITLDNVISNHEVTWSETNPEFVELLEGLSEEELAQYPEDDLWGWVSADYQIPYTILHYENSATGENFILSYYGNYYSERTQENINANGDNWWADFR